MKTPSDYLQIIYCHCIITMVMADGYQVEQQGAVASPPQASFTGRTCRKTNPSLSTYLFVLKRKLSILFVGKCERMG